MKTQHVRPIRPVVGVVALLLVVVVAVGAGFVTSAAAETSGQSAYSDPAGDGQGGPDVTAFTVTSDPATGRLDLAATVSGIPLESSDGLERGVHVWLDTDRNMSTGDPVDGTDYGVMAWTDAEGRWWNMGRWNGSEWESIPQSPTMSSTRSIGGLFRWTLNASDLGGATSFRFYALAGTFDASGNRVTVDDAPDSGWWDYDPSTTSSPPPPTTAPPDTTVLRIAAPLTEPRQPVAGKRFTIRFPVRFVRHTTVFVVDLSDPDLGGRTEQVVLDEPVQGGKMVCHPSVAGRVIPHSESFKGGLARLAFTIPKNAKGKLLKVKVTITTTDPDDGATMTATKTATFRIR
jgi:hypothetical protein